MRQSIESIEVPETFYVRADWAPKEFHPSAAHRVLAQSGPHFKPDWITLGFVSKQSPRGQGVFMGFPLSLLRVATTKEVLRALEQDHPHGNNFRPGSQETMTLGIYLVMSEGTRNWTNNNTVDTPNIEVSQQQLREEQERFRKERALIIAEWPSICTRQAKAIRSTLKDST